MRPSSLVTAYEKLLVENVAAVQTIESTIRNVTYFLPGRFVDSDVASEGLYTLLSLVSSFHDALLSRRVPQSISLPPHPFSPGPSSTNSSEASSTLPPRVNPLLPPPSDHTRYTRYWTERSATYRRASRTLVTLSYVELLVEMVARKKAGDRARWRIVLGIESMKTLLRLLLLRITKRAVLSIPVPQREYDISQLPQEVLNATLPEAGSSTTPALTSVPPNAPLRSHLYPLIGALPDSHQSHPLTLLPELSSFSEYTSEILACSATLVHVILLLRSSRASPNPKYKRLSLASLSTSLPPFLLPLAMHILSRRLRSSPSSPTPLQSSNWAQRDRRLATFFFLQGPVWVGWTRPKIMSIAKGLERIPLVGILGEFMEGYIPLVDDYFYSPSLDTSS